LDKAKPFGISKREVWEAYKRVKANQGAAGVDGQSIAEFEEDLKNNLCKLWNRMSSGSYFPLPVRRVDIPKDGDGRRQLGIPAVADRIAQAEGPLEIMVPKDVSERVPALGGSAACLPLPGF
jgi:retron-type reverse transcriptase